MVSVRQCSDDAMGAYRSSGCVGPLHIQQPYAALIHIKTIRHTKWSMYSKVIDFWKNIFPLKCFYDNNF